MINIQWFPGHMAKTRRILKENLKMVDVVVELLDARIPISSQNPEIENIIGSKPRIVVLNKFDLSDPNVNKLWRDWYAAKGHKVIFVDCTKGKGIKEVKDAIKNAVKEKVARDKEKGRLFRSVKTMVVGIPNVGKSSFINQISGRASAVTGDRPGVTRGKQWIRINNEIELMDTPGILWPKFEDPNVGLKLAYTGAIKDDVYDTVEVAAHLLDDLKLMYPNLIKSRYKLDSLEPEKYDLLELTGKKRGCIISGGVVDLVRTSIIILDELRAGRIGKISLEKPPMEDRNVEHKEIDA